MTKIKILDKEIGDGCPVYFIADVAANHDGDLDRAKMLIELAKESGVDAVKFQNHRVENYVSEKGFESLGGQFSHQSKWKKSVFEVYKDAETPLKWTKELTKHCEKLGIHYFTTPYDLGLVDIMDPFIPAFKIGSGDINWPDMLKLVASKNKPVFLASGASTLEEVKEAVKTITAINKDFVLMQCNTNYTADDENFSYINLNVLKVYRKLYPDMILGLSDHTLGHATVLGAVALGAKVVEKHFTDDNNRDGPDHKFAMNPQTFKEMVDETRRLERAMGDGVKKVEGNEEETVILQRRCLRASRDLKSGEKITKEDFKFQRPAPKGSFRPAFAPKLVGKTLKKDVQEGDYFSEENI